MYSLPSLLRYEDRNSMAHSIESRIPFLDHELVEWIFRLPPSAIIPTESNYLLNPQHKDFRAIRIAKPRPFEFDLRLLRG